MRTKLLLLIVLALASSIVGAAASVASGASRSTVKVQGSSYGRILFDGRGFALYAFTRDPRGKSICRGACATAWPPYLVNGKPRTAAGVNASRLGTIRRAGGKVQATYGGRPLYYYVGDRRPGQVLCQNVKEFGGLWLVIRPDGRLVR